MFWYLSLKDKCAVCVWPVGCLGRTANWRNREQSAVPMRQSSQTGNQISQSYQYDLCLAFCKNLFTLHLSSPIPCVYRHFGRWRVISNSSPTLHHSSPGLKIDRKMCILLYALMCRSIWVKSGEELLRTLHLCQHPCLSVFRRVWWRVKSISVFAST